MSTNDKLADALRLASNRLRRLALECPHGSWIGADAIEWAKEAENAALAAPPAQGEWAQGAPSKPWSEEWFIAVTTSGDRVVLRALPESYTYDFTTADDTHIKRDRIAKWMQFPDSEFIAPHPAPAPVQVDVLGELADEIEATYPNADASNLRAFAADAQPPAPGEAEVCDHAEVDKLIEFFRKEGYMRFGLNGDNMGWSPAETAIRAMREYMQKETAIAALAQQRVHVSDEMVERACKKYAFREDGALFPDDYSPREVAAERVLMREFLTHIIDQQQETRSNGD